MLRRIAIGLLAICIAPLAFGDTRDTSKNNRFRDQMLAPDDVLWRPKIVMLSMTLAHGWDRWSDRLMKRIH